MIGNGRKKIKTYFQYFDFYRLRWIYELMSRHFEYGHEGETVDFRTVQYCKRKVRHDFVWVNLKVFAPDSRLERERTFGLTQMLGILGQYGVKIRAIQYKSY